MIEKIYDLLNTFVVVLTCACLLQGLDRRVRDYQVPSAWHPGRSFTCATSDTHQKIPGTFESDSSPVVFIDAVREVVEQGMMGREKGHFLPTHLTLRSLS